MTPPDDPRDVADVVVAGLLDGDQGTPAHPEADPRRVADLQLLHALLQQVHRPDDEDARVARVLDALDDRHGRDRLRLRPTAWIGGLAAASLVVACLAVLGPPSRTATAREVYQAALAKALEPGDRRYRVHVERDGGLPDRDLVLTLRDRRHFVLETSEADPGPRLALGVDGRDAWLVPPIGPVLVRLDGAPEGRWLDVRDEQLPFLNLATALERLGDGYDLRDAEGVPTRPGERAVVAERRPGVGRGPRLAEFRVEADTGTVTRLHLTWDEPRGRRPRDVEIRLVGRPSVPDSFYGHDAHHPPGRPVLAR